MPVFKQLNYTARFDWGYEGVEQVGSASDMIVIIDVFSFSTCVDIVTGRGGIVYPYQVKDESHLPAYLQKCASGQELISMGYSEDVALAAAWNQSCTVPVLNDDFAYEAI
ncbi:hypothetical protein [Brevibacillus fortis]|uniref:hypothetical protein n=1 Tax=Brevibacillus fortis TaxID=2126352 RepID=UPI0038FC6916